MIPCLSEDPNGPFPPVESALEEPDGLLAWGGDLAPERLISAYRQGIFPWYSLDQPILWWSPSRRCVIFPEALHVSRRLRRILRQERFTLSADRDFAGVVHGCALPGPGRESTWITPEMQQAYERLHRMGFAHSVEVWANGALAGGIYGVSIGRVFVGESMFSRVNDASKVALTALCRALREWGYLLLDCQISNPHLQRLGATEISRRSYLRSLEDNSQPRHDRHSWRPHFGWAGEKLAPPE